MAFCKHSFQKIGFTCKSTLLSISTRLVTIFTGESAPAEILLLFGFVKTGKTVRGVSCTEEQNELASCHLWICFAVIVEFARSSNDVQVKQR